MQPASNADDYMARVHHVVNAAYVSRSPQEVVIIAERLCDRCDAKGSRQPSFPKSMLVRLFEIAGEKLPNDIRLNPKHEHSITPNEVRGLIHRAKAELSWSGLPVLRR